MASEQSSGSKHDQKLPVVVTANEEQLSSLTKPESSDNKVKCKTCQKTFPQRTILQKHALIHFAKQYRPFIDVEVLDHEGVIKCAKCGRIFKRFKTARKHFELHMTETELRYMCGVCSLGFYKKASYVEHKLTHASKPTGEYQCDQCDKAYARRASYLQHLLVHKYLKEGKFRCEPCSKNFASKYQLNSHYLTHNQHRTLPEPSKESPDFPVYCNESPDESLYCKQCGIQFYYLVAFYAHQRMTQTNNKRSDEITLEHSGDKDQKSVAFMQEPQASESNSTIELQLTVKLEPVGNDDANEDVQEYKQEELV